MRVYSSTLLLSLFFPGLSFAQLYGPAPGPVTPSAPVIPTAPPDTAGFMNIDVAFQESFTFHPNNIQAPVGTIVTFYFPSNGLSHSVTQSSFDNPCSFLAANESSGAPAGFDSGLQEGVQFSINITDSSVPIYFHCKQLLHCGMGMVGLINAPADGTNTFENFQAAAMAIGSNEVTESDNGPVLGGIGAIATAPPANTATVSGSSSAFRDSIPAVPLVMVFAGLLIGPFL